MELDKIFGNMSWFEVTLASFNALCLLAMLIVLSHTIYTVLSERTAVAEERKVKSIARKRSSGRR